MDSTNTFAILAALILVTTKLIFDWMEEGERAKGMPVNHNEYTMQGLLGIIFTERLDKIKKFFKKLWKKVFGERKQKNNGGRNKKQRVNSAGSKEER